MVEYDNSKTFFEFEMQRKIDKQKNEGLSIHGSEIRMMDRLLDSLNEYMTYMGKESNAYNLCFDLKKQIEENKKQTEEYMDLL
jgi:hypothetical protein